MGTAHDFFERVVTRQRLARAIPIILTLTIMWYLAKCFARSFFKSKPKARPVVVTPQMGNNNNNNANNTQQIQHGVDNSNISNPNNDNNTSNLISTQNKQNLQVQQQQSHNNNNNPTPRRNIPSCLNNTVIIQAMEKFNTTTNQQPPVQQQNVDEQQEIIPRPLRKYKIHHFHHPLKNRTAALDLEALANDSTNNQRRAAADPIVLNQRQFLPVLQQENYYKNLLINNHHTKVVKQVLGDNTQPTALENITTMSDMNTRNQMTLLNNIIQSHPGKMLDNQHLSGVLAGNHLLFATKSHDGSIDYTTLNPHVAQYIQYLLYNNVKLYLIITCTSQKDELAAYHTLRQAKIVKTSSKSTRLALPAHHVLFCAKQSTISSYIRQILPFFAITTDVSHITLQIRQMVPYIIIAPSALSSASSLTTTTTATTTTTSSSTTPTSTPSSSNTNTNNNTSVLRSWQQQFPNLSTSSNSSTAGNKNQQTTTTTQHVDSINILQHTTTRLPMVVNQLGDLLSGTAMAPATR